MVIEDASNSDDVYEILDANLKPWIEIIINDMKSEEGMPIGGVTHGPLLEEIEPIKGSASMEALKKSMQ